MSLFIGSMAPQQRFPRFGAGLPYPLGEEPSQHPILYYPREGSPHYDNFVALFEGRDNTADQALEKVYRRNDLILPSRERLNAEAAQLAYQFNQTALQVFEAKIARPIEFLKETGYSRDGGECHAMEALNTHQETLWQVGSLPAHSTSLQEARSFFYRRAADLKQWQLTRHQLATATFAKAYRAIWKDSELPRRKSVLQFLSKCSAEMLRQIRFRYQGPREVDIVKPLPLIREVETPEFYMPPLFRERPVFQWLVGFNRIRSGDDAKIGNLEAQMYLRAAEEFSTKPQTT